MFYKDIVGAVSDIGKVFYKDIAGVVSQIGRCYYKDIGGTVHQLKLSLNAYQKYASADLLKPKYSPSHGLYVGYKLNTEKRTQPFYSTDLINWTMFTNTYWEESASWGGSMGEVFPFRDRLIVHGKYNGSWNYAGREYLFAYASPLSAYTQLAVAGSDGSIYPIIDKGVGFYSSYIGNNGAKTSLVSSDAVNWTNVTYRANGRGGAASDGKIFVVNGDVTNEFQLAEIDAISKTEKLMFVGSGLNYNVYGQLIGSTFCDAAGYYYWAANTGNGVMVKMSKGSYGGNRPIATVQTNIPAPIKLMSYSPQLDTFLAVDINNVAYELPGSEITAQSVFTVVDASLGSTINSIAVGNGEFIIQSSSGIFVLK